MNRRPPFNALPLACLLLGAMASFLSAQPAELRTGVAEHAFDHNGSLADQGETAAASGATIIYVSGVGGFGYQGQPEPEIFRKTQDAAKAYLQKAKRAGIRLAIGYVCATSIVNLDTFDKNWTPEFRARFHSPPSAWRQQDRNGNYLPSWYGGQYQPACMNNPDWREYERFMVREQLESGCDGIFFDNPTVHEHGCYCPECMKKFGLFLQEERQALPPEIGSSTNSTAALREWADKHPADFLKFRGTIARDFIAEMRTYARTIKPGALITANNSLNSPDVFFSQCRSVAYNIYEMSRAEDFVVIEDMSTQARTLPDGRVFEYSPIYHLLHAISHGKPLVAVTVADSDYTTPPNLMRLAAAEAAANDASSLFWPTWTEPQRARMTAQFRPEMDLLRTNADLFQNAHARKDVLLFLPFREWLVTTQCRACQLAADLTRANIAFAVICEDDLVAGPPDAMISRLRGTKLLLAESASVFTPAQAKQIEKFKAGAGSVITADKQDWLATLKAAIGKPSVTVQGPPTVRAIVRDQPGKTIVHLLNLNVQKVDSYNDKVFPVSDLHVAVRVPFKKVHSVHALTADAAASSGALKFSAVAEDSGKRVELIIPRLDIATILVIE